MGALNTLLAAAATLCLVAMLNYLAAGHVWRFQWSRDAAFKLSRQTRVVLESLTNEVQVTIFFQPDGDNEDIYVLTSRLLEEYQNANPRHVHVRLLDYTRFPGPSKELLVKYDLNGSREKDFVLFESNGHHKIVYAREMAEYDFSGLLSGRTKFVRRNGFRGELLFTSDIYAVSNPQALKTYFLYGHGESNPGNPAGEADNLGRGGYTNLAAILKQKIDSDWDRLTLLGTNDVPRDCQLLIIAGPREGDFLPEEVSKIAVYLKNGGRLLALLPKPCGLELLLAKWGVRLGNSTVVDKNPTFNVQPGFFLTAVLCPHAVVNPLVKDKTPILMVATRPVYQVEDHGKIPGAPQVTYLASTSAQGVDGANHVGSYPLLAAVEQGVIKGVDTPRGGGTRMVVAGDADFLGDSVINSWLGNDEFAYLALTWLLQKPPLLLEGLVPHPIKEYRLFLTTEQSSAVRWLFLAGLPATILAFGGLVWLRRRH